MLSRSGQRALIAFLEKDPVEEHRLFFSPAFVIDLRNSMKQACQFPARPKFSYVLDREPVLFWASGPNALSLWSLSESQPTMLEPLTFGLQDSSAVPRSEVRDRVRNGPEPGGLGSEASDLDHRPIAGQAGGCHGRARDRLIKKIMPDE